MNQENLWAPWRGAYLAELARRADRAGWDDAPAASFIAAYWQQPERDVENQVIFRDEQGIVFLNRYPYAGGHLLVALGEARPTLLDYDQGQRSALWRLVEVAMDLMQRTLHPQGINVGINQGRAAGAGVPGHLHAHLVPRWNGDTNFMSVIGHVRVVPESLEEMARRYRATGTEARRHEGTKG